MAGINIGCAGQSVDPVSVGKQELIVRNGTAIPTYGLILILKTDKSRVNAGDDIEVTEELRNVTDHEIWENFRNFNLMADELASYPPGEGLPAEPMASDIYPFLKNPRPRHVLFDVHDAPGLPQAVMTSKHFSTQILPGKSRAVTHRFRILRPGIYRFMATWRSSYSADHQDELWKGNLLSNPVEITVLP